MATSTKVGHVITTEQIDAVWRFVMCHHSTETWDALLAVLAGFGILACPKCGGTKRIRNQKADNGTFIIDAECWCPHNGWVIGGDDD